MKRSANLLVCRGVNDALDEGCSYHAGSMPSQRFELSLEFGHVQRLGFVSRGSERNPRRKTTLD